LYYVPVQVPAQRVAAYIRKHKLLKAGDRVAAAVSGGSDSVAMLRLLIELQPELGIVLSAVHFNHHLRGAESEGDEEFVKALAQRHDLEFHCDGADVARYAAESRASLETAARQLRYRFFRQVLESQRVDHIATGHTLDDQAETLLLKMARGAGTRGLAGIFPRLGIAGPIVSSESLVSRETSIIRPLLGTRRNVLQSYLRQIGQDWREDSSNRDLRHRRNRVRHGIVPRMEKYLNPAVREALAETAEIARAEEEYWQQELARALSGCWHFSEKKLNLAALASYPLAMQRRVLRAAAESLGLRLEFRHVEEILAVSSAEAKSAELPEGWEVLRERMNLRFDSARRPSAECSHQFQSKHNYQYDLPVPGKVAVPELGTQLEAFLVSRPESLSLTAELLDAEAIAGPLVVRNWQPGDRFWPAHTRVAKKVKELLQGRHIQGRERALWPVVVQGDQLIWMRGFAAPASMSPRGDRASVLCIQESPSGP
jgi:tRNA(Ile)-lysidine synthase